MANYIIEQFAKRANKYEPIKNGEFESSIEALRAKDELEAIGFEDLRVVDDDGMCVLFGEWR